MLTIFGCQEAKAQQQVQNEKKGFTRMWETALKCNCCVVSTSDEVFPTATTLRLEAAYKLCNDPRGVTTERTRSTQ